MLALAVLVSAAGARAASVDASGRAAAELSKELEDLPEYLAVGEPGSQPDFEWVRYGSLNSCFTKSPPDDKADLTAVFMDTRCACFKGSADDAVGKSQCSSGLPFYRYVTNDMRADDCVAFCVSKGLDLAGVIEGTECRCSASENNKLIWHRQHSLEENLKKDLLETKQFRPDLSHMVAPDAPGCMVDIYKYNGGLEYGGIPQHLVARSAQDAEYIDNIVFQAGCQAPDDAVDTTEGETYVDFTEAVLCAGQDPPECTFERTNCMNPSSMTQCPALCGQCIMEAGSRDCDDMNCDPNEHHCGCTPGESWPFIDQVTGGRVIPYVVDWTVDSVRMNALHEAMASISSRSCITWRSLQIAVEGVPYLKIQSTPDTKCKVDGIGFPRHSEGRVRTLDLFSCDSELYVGDIIHELMHVLGFDDEHRDPRAFHTIGEEGPFLEMADGLDPPAYNARTFMGARNPKCGDSKFDYRSIMMPGNNRFFSHIANVSFTTRPRVDSTSWLGGAPQGIHDVLLGNRQSLSDMDAERLRCVYQCPVAEPRDACVNAFEADGEATCAQARESMVKKGDCVNEKHCCEVQFCPDCPFYGQCDLMCNQYGVGTCAVPDKLVHTFRDSLEKFSERIQLLHDLLQEVQEGNGGGQDDLLKIYNSLVHEVAYVHTLVPGVS